MANLNRNEIRSIVLIMILLMCAALFRLAGVHDVLTGVPEMFISLLRSYIYIAVIIIWGISIYRRVLHSAVRSYLLAIAGLLLFWFALRTCKYLLLEGLDAAQCCCWYGFYIPMLLIPLMAVFMAACLGRPDSYKLPALTGLLYIPAAGLIILVLTNSFHKLVFSFPGRYIEPGGDYVYRWGYFICAGWILVEVTAFLALMLRRSHVPGKHRRIWAPVVTVGIGVLYAAGYAAGVPVLDHIAGDMTSVFTLVMIATCEACIRTGLIPSNTRYDELFRISGIGAQIVDESYEVQFASDTARSFDRELMKKAGDGYVDMGTERLSSAPVRGGHVLWIEDMSEVKKLMKELESTGRRLSESNNLLRAEVELKENQAKADEQMRLYDKITEEVSPQLELLEHLLDKEDAAEDMHIRLAQACVISSYIKRRSNLILLGEEAGFIPAQELEYCLHESVENIRLCGVAASLACRCDGILAKDAAVAAYGFFESVTEAAIPFMDALLVNLAVQRECIDMTFSISCDPEAIRADSAISGCSGAEVAVSEQEGDVNITFSLPGGGAGR